MLILFFSFFFRLFIIYFSFEAVETRANFSTGRRLKRTSGETIDFFVVYKKLEDKEVQKVKLLETPDNQNILDTIVLLLLI